MLKRKIQQQLNALDAGECTEKQFARDDNEEESKLQNNHRITTAPLWQRFYEIELELNAQLEELGMPPQVIAIYNPLEYAAETHCAYLKHYLTGTKRVMFVGMNPGPNGMGQTGIPFGNIITVRDLMKITGDVRKPAYEINERPITGMLTKIDEPSGKRLWNLFYTLAGSSLHTFSQQCFVHNFCPLIFYGSGGKNITPSELKAEHKANTRNWCLEALEKQFALVQPEIVVAVGDYVYTALKKSNYCKGVKTLRLMHPSPRSLNNHNWPEKATQFLASNDLLKYLQNNP